MKLTPAGTYQATALGLEDAWKGDGLGRRAIVRRPIRQPSCWEQLDGQPFGRQEEVNIEAARHRLPAETALMATVFGPASTAMQLAGMDLLMEHMASSPHAVEAGLNVLCARTTQLIDAFSQAGVDGIYFVSQVCGAGGAQNTDALQRLMAWDRAAMAAVGNRLLRIAHIHGASLAAFPSTGLEGWTQHYEWSAANPDPGAWGRQAGTPLAVTLPLEVIAAGPGPDGQALIAGRMAQAGG